MEFPKDNKLTFFSLYMHLQDLAGYENDKTLPRPAHWKPDFRVTPYANDRPMKRGERAAAVDVDQVGLRVRATPQHGAPRCILPRGAQFSVGTRAGDWGQITATHGAGLIPPRVGDYVAPTDAIDGWVFLGEEGGRPVVEEVWPDAMFDRVVTLERPIPVRAGALVGHPGRYDSLARQTEDRMVHLEVFCDEGIDDFIQQGRNWVRSHGYRPGAWLALGLASEPTLLRIARRTRLWKAPLREGGDAPTTDVDYLAALAELARNPEDKYDETPADADTKRRPWWRVRSADMLGRGRTTSQ
ncbi:hypothetical protein [Cupriavidus agavae]|nr:hypothetical protein [Cupriavidus agavae]